jgi:TolB protein
MRPHRSRTLLHATALLILAGAPAASLLAQANPNPPAPPPQGGAAGSGGGQITGVISAPGLTRLAVAIPPIRLSPLASAAVRAAAEEVRSTVISDLEFSGYFDVIPPERYADIPLDATPVPFTRWAATNAVALLIGTATPEADRLALEGLLFDTRGQQLILGKRYRGETTVARIIGHRLSNEIVLHFTGRQGIALSRIALEGRVGKAKEIFIMDFDGRSMRQVTRNGSLNVAPAISPDGTKVAFVSYKSGMPHLYVLAQDGPMTDISPPGADLSNAPDWSPDGKQIVFSAAKEGDSEIYIYDFASGRSRRITTSPASETSPSWSPSGREIAFTSDRTGRPQIYVMDAEGGSVRRLTFDGTYNDQAAWAPDGNRIAYAGWVDDHFDIFVMDVASGVARRITDAAGYNENPRWSADGRHIVFTSNRVGIYQIFTMDDNGNRPARLSTPFEAWGPDWSK